MTTGRSELAAHNPQWLCLTLTALPVLAAAVLVCCCRPDLPTPTADADRRRGADAGADRILTPRCEGAMNSTERMLHAD